jgi:hypothetical protein
VAHAGWRVPNSVVASANGWQSIRVGGRGSGIAFRLVGRGIGTAILFATRIAQDGLPSAPPSRPQSTSGGKSIGYWRHDGVVYIIVVEGDEQLYRRFIGAPSRPLA